MKLLLLIAVAALFTAACGDDSQGQSAETAGDSPVATSETSTGTVVPDDGRDPPAGDPTPAPNVTGRVTTADGLPVAGAFVEVVPLDGQPAPEFDSIRRTDEQGHFELVLQPGAWDLTITPDGQEPNTTRIDVAAQGVTQLDVQLT